MFYSLVPISLPSRTLLAGQGIPCLALLSFHLYLPQGHCSVLTVWEDCPWAHLCPREATPSRPLQGGQGLVTPQHRSHSAKQGSSAHLQEMCVWQVAFFPVVKKDHVKCVHIVLRLQLRDEVLGCSKEDGDLEQCSVSAVPTGICRSLPGPHVYIHQFLWGSEKESAWCSLPWGSPGSCWLCRNMSLTCWGYMAGA